VRERGGARVRVRVPCLPRTFRGPPKFVSEKKERGREVEEASCQIGGCPKLSPREHVRPAAARRGWGPGGAGGAEPARGFDGAAPLDAGAEARGAAPSRARRDRLASVPANGPHVTEGESARRG